jgi:hypothetical protein
VEWEAGSHFVDQGLRRAYFNSWQGQADALLRCRDQKSWAEARAVAKRFLNQVDPGNEAMQELIRDAEEKFSWVGVRSFGGSGGGRFGDSEDEDSGAGAFKVQGKKKGKKKGNTKKGKK